MSPLPTFVSYDQRLYSAEVAYFDDLRATFNDRLPIHSYAPFHPLMPKTNSVEANRARQVEVLQAVAHYQAEEAKRGQEMAHEFEAAQQPPKPGQPGYKPPTPNVPGTPTYNPNLPNTPNPAPGQPGHDPNLPHDPNAPDPQHASPQPSIEPRAFEEYRG